MQRVTLGEHRDGDEFCPDTMVHGECLGNETQEGFADWEIDYSAMDAAAKRLPPPEVMPDAIWFLLSDAAYEVWVAQNLLAETYRVKDEPMQRLNVLSERLGKALAEDLEVRKTHGLRFPQGGSIPTKVGRSAGVEGAERWEQ